MKLPELELQLLAALDELREAECGLSCEGATKSPKLVEEVFLLRMRCENAERKYVAALGDLGFESAIGELNNNPHLEDFRGGNPEGGSHELAGGGGEPKISTTPRGVSDRIVKSGTMMYAQTEDEIPLPDEDWDHERKKFEELMLSLGAIETQNPLLISRLRTQEENLFTSLLHQRTRAETESSSVLAAYKDCLNRTASLVIDLDALYMQIGRINNATDLDLETITAIRAGMGKSSQRSAGPSRCTL